MFRYWSGREGYYCLGAERVPQAAGRRFLVADLALSERESADYTVIGVFDLINVAGVPNLLLVDLWRARAQAPAVKARLWAMYREHHPEFAAIEKAHYGMAYCQELRREGMMIRELIPDKDKLTRARTASVAFENGRVWFPDGRAQMMLDVEHELLTFPDGAHDDQVDVMSYACEILRTNGTMASGQAVTVQRTGIDGYAAPHRPQGNRPPWA
jgi:predicted phage terminase large subunit-like protein